MDIQISYQREIPEALSRKIRQSLERALKDLDCNDREISVLFTGDREIALLNEKYLGRKGPTDVISFPMEGDGDGGLGSSLLGDVAISVDTAAREAEQSGETLERSVMRLLAHGLLHLLGYDHEGSESLASEMEKQEARLIELM